ncbi:MAG: hypothetical protein ACK4FB_13905 [Brevundimonas sp.]|uniref:hypothetical protein n=1 Tax=Brevundimonas sp. TaxID=1871086 RepID=UPI00391AC6FF
MIRALILPSIAVLALAACGQPDESAPETPPAAEAPAQTPDSNALSAQGWGPLRIGMTRAEITRALGPDANPDAVGGPDPESCDQYRPERAPEGVLLMLEQGVLTRISLIREATLTTDRGFGIGDSAADIKAAYGDAAQVSPHKYVDAPAEYITVWTDGPSSAPYREDPDARGVVYEIGADGNVSMIHVGGPSIQYVEGCS